ncbi:hypothetical protein PNOK_0718900 [Pyrrhoderma noxium]|uniref:G-patch domain-containing protein n=1 Tax=Pyrrhoderma noxium TaxID=2282107 RepID=A0A286UC76_9AGAM|nr:hypothetical protein PNOK_0718900 [Pyrrhoderma noxium]
MATVAYHIKSNYDPEEDKERLILETGQLTSDARDGIDDDGDDTQKKTEVGDEEDAWLKERPFGVNKRIANPPRFVRATVEYDIEHYDGYERLEQGGSGSSVTLQEKDSKEEKEEVKSVGSWYRTLVKNSGSTTTSTTTTNSASVSGRCTPSSSFETQELDTFTNSQKGQKISMKKYGIIKRDRNNWFITRALEAEARQAQTGNEPQPSSSSSNSKSSSGSGTGNPSYSTLADILARDPPPKPTEAQYTPPVWLAIGPSNKGFTMLERSGWREGEAIGRASRARGGLGYSGKGKEREVDEVKEPEIIDLSYVDDRIIDLTQTDEDEDDEEKEIEKKEVVEGRTAVSLRVSEQDQLVSETDLDHNPRALITPLPTVLKADRLGIGLKAKMVGRGIYREPVRKVTHSQAAMAAHVRAGEALKKEKRIKGRGRRGFEKVKKREAEHRKFMLNYLNT